MRNVDNKTILEYDKEIDKYRFSNLTFVTSLQSIASNKQSQFKGH